MVANRTSGPKEIELSMAIKPINVWSAMDELFPEIESWNNDTLENNPFYLLTWYQRQLTTCTEKCYEELDCKATWGFIKSFSKGSKSDVVYPEVYEAIQQAGPDADNEPHWFMCLLLNSNYESAMRTAHDTSTKNEWVSKPGTSDAYLGIDKNIYDPSVIASHGWIKPINGANKECLVDNELLINIDTHRNKDELK